MTVLSSGGKTLGTGFYNDSSIAVKMFGFGPADSEKSPLDLMEERLKKAAETRAALGLLGNPKTNAYRIVNGEGDLIPGLIVDRYGRTAVMQGHHPAIHRQRESLAELIRVSCDVKSVLYHDEVSAKGSREWLTAPAESRMEIVENGRAFMVDLERGQKTGFFLDQRENRALVGSLAAGRSVLNVCSYTGGFSVYAAAGGAARVTSLDASKDALTAGEGNMALSGFKEIHSSVCADCFDYLTETSEQYGCVILDPPAFAKHRGAIKSAVKGYRALNKLGMNRLSRSGILVTFSCSQLVSRDEFESAVLSGVIDSGRHAKVLYRLSQAPCHPTSLHHPEGPYLKGLVLEAG